MSAPSMDWSRPHLINLDIPNPHSAYLLAEKASNDTSILFLVMIVELLAWRKKKFLLLKRYEVSYILNLGLI